MRYVDLRTITGFGLVEGEKDALAAADACVGVLMDSCPAVRLIKVYVHDGFAKEAMKNWELLDMSPNLAWYTFQAFPMRNAQRINLVELNSKRMAGLLKVSDLSAFPKNRIVQQRRLFLDRL